MKKLLFVGMVVISALLSGCAIGRYAAEYPDGTEIKVYVGGFCKEPTIGDAKLQVGTNAVFSIKKYTSTQDAAKSVLEKLIDKAGDKL